MVGGHLNRKERLPISAALLALMGLCLVVPLPAHAVSDVEMSGFKLVQETGNGRWEISADKAYYDGQGDVILRNVSARMLSGDAERVKVVSDTGRYESEGLILHLEGRVVVASGFGSRFETPRLRWNGPEAVMTAGEGVWLERGGFRISGKTVMYMVNSGKATVKGDVRTTWEQKGE